MKKIIMAMLEIMAISLSSSCALAIDSEVEEKFTEYCVRSENSITCSDMALYASKAYTMKASGYPNGIICYRLKWDYDFKGDNCSMIYGFAQDMNNEPHRMTEEQIYQGVMNSCVDWRTR
jgi:hypothetical protein